MAERQGAGAGTDAAEGSVAEGISSSDVFSVALGAAVRSPLITGLEIMGR